MLLTVKSVQIRIVARGSLSAVRASRSKIVFAATFTEAASIAAGRPDRRKRDADNIPKAVCDLLVTHQVIRDDNLVRTLTTTWASTDTVPPGRLLVAVASCL